MENNFERKCPTCERIIKYSNKYNLKNAENNNRDCKVCSSIKSRPEGFREKLSERFRGEKNPMWGKFGNKNPFYGKKHSKETIEKILKNRDYSKYKTQEFRDKISNINKGNKNPMYGKSFYDIWVEKYGEDFAKEKMKSFKVKNSKNSKGDSNPMFGKPSPKKSGNGWSGWYKGWFFRSILELSYMIFVIERFGLKWQSGESKKYMISYTEDNVKKNYFPDFIIDEKYVVECKPKNLCNIKKNKLKFEYAKKYCNENNLTFKVRQTPKLKKNELNSLVESGLVILTEKWKNRLK